MTLRGKSPRFRRHAAALGALLLAACAALPGPEEGPPPPAGGAVSPAGKEPERPADRGGQGDRLDEPVFRGLPAEARTSLKALSAAFRARDRAFLLAQGEPQFEKEVRPRYDEETYLALLYRIGPLSREDAEADNALPRLDPAAIRGLEYADWEEEGPLLEIRGRLIPVSGPPVPCRIMLVWRLREPKVLGIFP
jgi:hypothetical protein